MGARGSIPVQMLERFAENTLFAAEPVKLDGVRWSVKDCVCSIHCR